MLIDPPSLFADIAEWEQFLRSLKAMEQGPEVIENIANARQVIADKQAP